MAVNRIVRSSATVLAAGSLALGSVAIGGSALAAQPDSGRTPPALEGSQLATVLGDSLSVRPLVRNSRVTTQSGEILELALGENQGYITSAEDMDAWGFRIDRPGKVTLQLDPLYDLDMALLDEYGDPIAYNPAGGTAREVISENLAPGVYYVVVGSTTGAYSAVDPYTLTAGYVIRPGAVRRVKVKYPRRGVAQVRWAAGSAGLASPTAYQVRITKPNKAKYGKWKRVTSPSATFRRLKRDAEYRAQIRAVNSAGAGERVTKRVKP